MTAHVIAVVNQKGGVSKSTTAQIIGDALTLKGERVLFVDLDAQGNLTYALGSEPVRASSYAVLTGTADADQSILETAQGALIPASPMLSTLDTKLSSTRGRAYILRDALRPILERYDYIIIDTPPALGNTVINALTAADEAVIPVKADVFSLQGLAALSQTLEAVMSSTNSGLRIAGILLQQYNSRTVLSRQITEMVDHAAVQLKTRVFTATIRDATAIREAQALQTNVVEYAKRQKVGQDIRAFMRELIPAYK